MTSLLNGVSTKRMSRPNLARLEPSAYAVLSVADPAKVATKTEQVLGELDLDHLCRLLIRSERSLSLVNRRSFAAALADVPPIPNQALRPAPPFPEAVAVAREDGKLLERTRLFLAQNPRALEELTPELTLALLRHFDPTMRMRPSPFTRHIVAVGSVTVIALLAAILGIVHTQQNEAVTSVLRLPSAGKAPHARVAVRHANIPVAAVPPVVHSHYDNDVAVIARGTTVTVPVSSTQVAAVQAPVIASPSHADVTAPVYHIRSQASASTAHHVMRNDTNAAALFVPAAVKPVTTITTSAPAAAEPIVPAAQQQVQPLAHAQLAPQNTVSGHAVATTTTTAPATAQTSQDSAAATALVLRTIVSENPNANVEWIRASKVNDQVVTVTSRVHHGDVVSDETYHLWNSHGSFTVINHDSTNTEHSATP